MENNYLTLWTVQPIEWYEKLLRNGIIYTTKEYINFDFYGNSIVWLKQQMIDKIGKPFNEDLFPIWAWYHYLNANKKRPDLRGTGFLPKGHKGVRIEFIKKESEVLLSDFSLWHCVLNYFYIADNEKESDEFDALLDKFGLKFTERENAPTEIHKMIMESWQKIFNMNYCPKYAASSFEKKSIQATFWSLSVDEIKKIDKFVAK